MVARQRLVLLERQLPREPYAGRLARRELTRRLGEQGLEECVEDAATIVAELVNNAYLHGDGRIVLRVEQIAGRLRIEVFDDGAGHGARGDLAQRLGPGGLGLRLVGALAQEVGREPERAHVWAELSCSRHAGGGAPRADDAPQSHPGRRDQPRSRRSAPRNTSTGRPGRR
jgi:anti-sigma regulatory factor (Ser/Thr protein kinase)